MRKHLKRADGNEGKEFLGYHPDWYQDPTSLCRKSMLLIGISAEHITQTYDF